MTRPTKAELKEAVRLVREVAASLSERHGVSKIRLREAAEIFEREAQRG